MHPSENDWSKFYAAIKQRTGLDLGLYKANQMHRRIISMAGSQKCKDLAAFANFIQQSPANVESFLDRLAINVSELFRNPEKWAELEKIILPHLLKNSKTLKIWSAGCSYGAEAHSMAAVIDSKFPGAHRIIGSDIDTAALNQAKTSEFNASDVRTLPAEYVSYFVKQKEKYIADDRLKKYLEFKKQNLLADPFESGFNLIMCRNVVIYFTDEAKIELYKKFYNSLKPGGILWVGSTERITQEDTIGYNMKLPFYYEKPMLGDKNG